MSLFLNLQAPDRQRTQLAYKVKFFPWREVPTSAKLLVSWRRFIYRTKTEVLKDINDEMTCITYKNRCYTIVWEYNNIPTQQEWERKSDNYQLSCDFRFSPLIPELAVCILSFY
jgi:hypothetical protein